MCKSGSSVVTDTFSNYTFNWTSLIGGEKLLLFTATFEELNKRAL